MKSVIIGAGPAGVTAAETFRNLDTHAEIIVLSDEPYPPYSPPAMADHFISGSNAHLWRGENWHEHFKVDHRRGVQVISIDPAAQQLQLSKGGTLPYDQLVIASGSKLYAPLSGADSPGVYNFKSLSAAEKLIQQVRAGQGKTAIIIGAGFIGMEIALLLSELGVEVTQVEMLDQVMPRMLDRETAVIALDAMTSHGIRVHLNTKAKAFIGDEKIEAVELESGDTLKADLFIAATGVKPNVEFLGSSEVAFERGIRVDNQLRTNIPNIFAAGDVIESADRMTGEQAVHAIFPNAVEQGRVVGMNLAGRNATYEGADRMNSLKHLGLPIMAVGDKEGDDVLRVQREGDLRTIYLKDHRIVGFQLVGDLHPAGALRTLMNRRENVRALKDRLLEPTFGQGTLTWAALTPSRV